MEAKNISWNCNRLMSRSFVLSQFHVKKISRGTFFRYVLYSTLLHLLPLRFHGVDAGIEPRTVATLALAVRRSNLSG
jgi:hypothetical protein